MKASLHLIFLCFVVSAAALSANAAEQLYTCGMHPQIIKKEPGNCPICGMKLTPIHGSAGKTAAASTGERKIKYYKSTMMPGEVKPGPGKDSMGMDMVPVYDDQEASAQNNIQIDAATIQRMNLRTARLERGPVRREIRTVGTVAFNEQGLRDVTTKYEGWIEKLYANTTWATVKAGDPLFEIYSPDLYNAELNYLVALRSEGEAGGPLTRASVARLQLFDIPTDVIVNLKQSGEAQRTLVFRAPSSGVVIEKMGIAGQMMKAGERIYRLADLSSVWVEAQVYEKDLPYLHEGQAASIRTSYGPERKLEGTVELVLPQVEEQTRSATARIVLANPDGFLRPGMFVEVSFASQLKDDAVLVPDMAVLRSGERNTVFVALDGGFFEARQVTLGARGEGGFYEVLAGLTAGERVVTSGQFMLDSESQLREAIQKMLKPESSEAAPSAEPNKHPAATVTTDPSSSAAASSALGGLAGATADLAASLAADDLGGYNRELSALRTALAAYFAENRHAAHGLLGSFRNGLPEATDLVTARNGFTPFSTAVADLVHETGGEAATGLHVFHCAMKNARWLQRGAEVKNPFFGAKMPDCGEEISSGDLKGEPSASSASSRRQADPLALPPGHPPLDAATLASFALAKNDRPAVSDGACGDCGMSSAAMAAGEPCEHEKK